MKNTIAAEASTSNLIDQNPNEWIEDPCDKVYDNKDGTTVSDAKVPFRIIWRNVIYWIIIHIAAFYGVYLMFTSAKWQTNIFAIILDFASLIGSLGGAHRLWSHRSFKAKLPLRILLAFMFTMSFQREIYVWARDHRVHHKYSDTDADPYNAKRGFFFSHIGWTLVYKHPEVRTKGKAIDISDVMADPVVRFQKKYYFRLVLLSGVILPTAIPMYFWNETFLSALMIATMLRYCCCMHQSFLLNSAAHKWGYRTYDANIEPRDNLLVAIASVGEGFHNFHHTFPYDYAMNDYGLKYDLTTGFINIMAFLGQAYDLKTASKKVIEARKLRTGEESLKRKSRIS